MQTVTWKNLPCSLHKVFQRFFIATLSLERMADIIEQFGITSVHLQTGHEQRIFRCPR